MEGPLEDFVQSGPFSSSRNESKAIAPESSERCLDLEGKFIGASLCRGETGDDGTCHDTGAQKPLAQQGKGQRLRKFASLPSGPLTPPHMKLTLMIDSCVKIGNPMASVQSEMPKPFPTPDATPPPDRPMQQCKPLDNYRNQSINKCGITVDVA